ncbi:MAG: hypothetical protein HGB28_03470, partial [Oscillochloris sp.]|nr:hypothetical protein [Oscillochloris sp.]
MAHADLEVLIQRWSDGGYAVDMRFRTADGQADTELALNVPIKLDLAALLERSNDPQAYGRTLTGMFFADQRLLNAFLRVRGFVEGADIPLRLRMRLDPEAPELHAVRWESFSDPDRNEPIARGELVMLSRYLDSANLGRIVVPPRDELKALVAVVSPRDLAKFKLQPFDGDAEADRVRKALGDIPAATLVSGPGQPPVSLNAICDALRFGYGIFYLVCHGVLRDGQPMLCLEGEDGGAAWVAGDELARKIADLS